MTGCSQVLQLKRTLDDYNTFLLFNIQQVPDTRMHRLPPDSAGEQGCSRTLQSYTTGMLYSLQLQVIRLTELCVTIVTKSGSTEPPHKSNG